MCYTRSESQHGTVTVVENSDQLEDPLIKNNLMLMRQYHGTNTEMPFEEDFLAMKKAVENLASRIFIYRNEMQIPTAMLMVTPTRCLHSNTGIFICSLTNTNTNLGSLRALWKSVLAFFPKVDTAAYHVNPSDEDDLRRGQLYQYLFGSTQICQPDLPRQYLRFEAPVARLSSRIGATIDI